MIKAVISIYQWFSSHRTAMWMTLVAVTLGLAAIISRINYQEDISAFLPLDNQSQEALDVYRDISGANRIFAIFSTKAQAASPDTLVECVDDFVATLQLADTSAMLRDIVAEVNLEDVSEMSDFVYSHIPLFLNEADYSDIDSTLSDPANMERRLAVAKEMLMFPSGGLLSDNLSRDPLNIFTPTVAQLQGDNRELNYEMYDGHILSADLTHAVVMIDSPFGSSETDHNKLLIDMLTDVKQRVESAHPEIEIHITGGPAIAVDNANQIKSDSMLALAIAVTLILALLMYAFRFNSNTLLIFLSIGWGAAFALGAMALIADSVSIIVIGISAVILGIAVNYPLHFITHLSHTPSVKEALKEIAMPLVVGNVTTVGAFMALVPLNSTALCHLGLFSSMLLVGTILFVLIFLPHLVKVPRERRKLPSLLERMADVQIHHKRQVVIAVVVITLILGYFSLHTAFDTNIANINYLTPQQRADMEYFSHNMVSQGDMAKVYVVSSAGDIDSALSMSAAIQPLLRRMVEDSLATKLTTCSRFIPSSGVQTERLKLWRRHIASRADSIKRAFATSASREGFNPDSFDDFYSLISESPEAIGFDSFEPLSKTLFAGNISVDSVKGRYSVIDILNVAPDRVDSLKEALDSSLPQGSYYFDVAQMNSSIANRLSDDFNYIGWACCLIVFFFLWFSMGNIELALLSFLPMAISWIWILGIMALLGIKFNIVNIILATFIFGQGDDYTIFMTEGAVYEYSYRRKMLSSYRSAIILSALIMFIGIGALIVARHPALRSLAEVTIVGMLSVVLMAYLFPPLIFDWLVKRHGDYRLRPLSVSGWLARRFRPASEGSALYIRRLITDRYRYRGAEVERAVRRELRSITPQSIASHIGPGGNVIKIDSDGYGVEALWIAIAHPDRQVDVTIPDPDARRIASIACAPFHNLNFD